MRKHFQRDREIIDARRRLERDGFPRLQMLLLVALTGAAGFIASYCMLHAGLEAMWLRYLAAFGLAYLVFLGLLWLWLRSRAADYADVPDFSGAAPAPDWGAPPNAFGGRDGSFDGGGASGNFETASDGALPKPEEGGIVGDAIGAVADADELAIPLGVILMLGMLLLSSLWIVYAAPLLLAELVVDGVLAASLYRRLRGLESRHWLETAIRRTIVPFAATAALLACAGWGMQQLAPEARSMGDAVLHFNAAR